MVTAHVTILTHILLHLYLMFLLSFHRLFYVFLFLLFLLHTKHNTDDDNRLLIWNDWVFYFWMKYYSEWKKKENKKRQEILYRMHWVRFCADLLHRPVHVYLFIMHNHVLKFLYTVFLYSFSLKFVCVLFHLIVTSYIVCAIQRDVFKN